MFLLTFRGIEEGRGIERHIDERDQLPSARSPLGTEPETWVCTLTGN